MDAAVHVGIHVQVFLAHGVEHAQRLLRRRGIVQIDQRPAVHLTPEDGEVLADLIDIVAHGSFHLKFHGVPAIVLIVTDVETPAADIFLQLLLAGSIAHVLTGVHPLVDIEVLAEDALRTG